MLGQLTIELWQPTFTVNAVGKTLVDKSPDGTASPNRADCVLIAFNPGNYSMEVWERLGSM